MMRRACCLAFTVLSLALIATAAPLLDAAMSAGSATACPSYIVIQTRGTDEPQGPSDGFILMNALTLSLVPGGKQYFTVYPAAEDQNSTLASDDIVSRVAQFVADDPKVCLLLQGYSQGAAATTVALNQLNGTSADAVKAVFLIGNPLHTPGLACNVDNLGANSTIDALGLQRVVQPDGASVPASFVNRTLDVCIPGDGICDSQNGVIYGSDGQHFQYAVNMTTQLIGYMFQTAFVVRDSYERVVLDPL